MTTKQYQWPPRMTEEQATNAIFKSSNNVDFAQRACDSWAELQEELQRPCRLGFEIRRNGIQYVQICTPWESGDWDEIDFAIFAGYYPDAGGTPGGPELTLGQMTSEIYNGAQPEQFLVLSWCCFLMAHATASWDNWNALWADPEAFIQKIADLYPNPHPTVVNR